MQRAIAFSGHASLFGVPDLAGDVMLPGAFAASLARRGPAGVKMLHQHDPGRPVGRWTALAEDARGLKVTGELVDGTEAAREVARLIAAGILDGLSIGFRTVRARTDPDSGLRHVAEVDLWEVSIVTFPMMPEARIARVTAERGLSDPEGLAAAMAVTARRLAAGAAPRSRNRTET